MRVCSLQIEQERNKYPTQQIVGFRFTGMRVPLSSGGVKEHGRAFGYALTQETLGNAFAEYLHDGERLRLELIPPLLQRLKAIRAYFTEQSEFRFYGSSLLFVYESDSKGRTGQTPSVDVRMIDFAHVWPIQGSEVSGGRRSDRDSGYLLGLDSIIGYLVALSADSARQVEANCDT